MGMGSEHRTLAALYREKPWYPLYRWLGGARSHSGWVQKISPPTRVRTPKCPLLIEALHRLIYPGHHDVHPAVFKTLVRKCLLHFSKYSFLGDSYLMIIDDLNGLQSFGALEEMAVMRETFKIIV
jgi:hypothetical protein